MLAKYIDEVQRFIHDEDQKLIEPDNLRDYINRGRREVAMRSQCIRRLTWPTGSIVSAAVISGGQNYTNPIVVITTPDFPSGSPPYPNGLQAVASAQQINGSIDTINIQVGGWGYFNPLITIDDPTGSGAIIAPSVRGVNTLNQGQEVYNFSDQDLSMWPGVDSIFGIQSVSVIYSNYRYSLPMYSFSVYQARVRQYPFQYQYVPSIGSQYGRGAGGSLYLYPLPSQTFQMEWDCFCLPSDLLDERDYEAVPAPWTDAVKHFAAYEAFLELQNPNSARMHLELFDNFMKRFGAYTQPGRVTNPYGRW